jgi:putative transposase
MRVKGLGQIPTDSSTEVSSATLIQRADDYFVHVSIFQTRQTRKFPRMGVGIDGGIKNQLTFSIGLCVIEGVPATKYLRRLQRRLSRRSRLVEVDGKIVHSNNWFETRQQLNREFQRITNQRRDIRNKIVSRTTSTFDAVSTQKDHVGAWQRLWGRRVQMSAIGGIMRDLRTKARTPIVVDRWNPTTRTCFKCGALNEVDLSNRIYECRACDFRTDRDWNASSIDWKQIPAECRESTPVDIKTATEMMEYFNGIPHVKASLVETPTLVICGKETGSHPTSSRW